MAARRLIIVLLALFAVSIVAAAIAPERDGSLGGDTSSSSSTTSTTTSTPEPPPDAGESLTARIDASASSPETVRGFVGDQLELEVGSEKPREIEIPDFGLIEAAAPEAPAVFNLLLREPGEPTIIDAESGATLGRLVVGRCFNRSCDKGR